MGDFCFFLYSLSLWYTCIHYIWKPVFTYISCKMVYIWNRKTWKRFIFGEAEDTLINITTMYGVYECTIRVVVLTKLFHSCVYGYIGVHLSTFLGMWWYSWSCWSGIDTMLGIIYQSMVYTYPSIQRDIMSILCTCYMS